MWKNSTTLSYYRNNSKKERSYVSFFVNIDGCVFGVYFVSALNKHNEEERYIDLL